MNILFRKHFHGEEGRGGGFGKSASKGGKGVHGKRSRGHDYSMMEEHHFRTHIFLSPPSGCQSCAAIGLGDTGDSGGRRSSVTLMKWAVGGSSSNRRKQSNQNQQDSPGASRQVSFSGNRETSGIAAGIRQAVAASYGAAAPSAAPAGAGGTDSSMPPPAARGEPVSLATLNRDCFIIPVASLDRFLPAGVPMPAEKCPSPVSVLEVEDPKLCVLLHLMSPLEAIEPELESPLARPYNDQRSAACALLHEVGEAKTALEGMLLANMEKNAEFPFIAYYVINKQQTDPSAFHRSLTAASLRKFDPRSIRYTAMHTLDLYNEVATIARPPLDAAATPGAKRPPRSPATGYIISVYKVFEGDDGEKFEQNWLYWTGARMLYRYLPKSVGLKRITLHKSISHGDKMYLLLCECSNFLENLNAAAILLPALRARLCGYTGLYRMTSSF